MASYTTNLRLTLPNTGEYTNTWGTVVNDGITTLLDQAVAGYVSIAMSDANYTLTTASGSTDEARRMIINLTGTLSAARNVICPSTSKVYFVRNNTTGGFPITFKTSAGTGVSVPNGLMALVVCDGVNVVSGYSTAALINYFPAGTGAVTTNVQTKLREFVSVKDFGAVGDGVTNDSTAFNNGLTYVKSVGATLYIPNGTYLVKNLRLEGATKAFAMIGAGQQQTILKHVDGDGTLINDSGSGTIGYLLQGFTVDAQYSVYSHPNARNGIAIYRRSNFTLYDIHIRDFRFSAALMWDSDNAGGVYSNGKVINCSCDGLGAGANGFLFVNMDNCSYSEVSAKGLVNNADGPGVGVQFKNRCRFGSATGIYAENCYVGLGFGGDTGGTIPGAEYCTASNIRTYVCNTGVAFTNAASNNSVTNVYIDQNSLVTSLDAIDFGQNAIGNSITNVTVRNLLAAKRAAFLREGCSNNNIYIAELDNISATGLVAKFLDTAQYNTVRLSRMRNPRVRTGNIYSMVAFDTEADNNSFTYDNYPFWDSRAIASDTVVLRNAIPAQTLVVDTEGAAATDDLATITNNYAQEGQSIILRTSNDSRTVTVKNGTGNITLTGTADFTLTTRRSMLCLVWNITNSRWNEAWRVTNL